jgi:hypothetical protein
MAYKFTSPRGDTVTLPSREKDAWEAITLSLPGDSPLAVPDDPHRWERRDERIVATYTREELAVAVGLALERKRGMLEARLERGRQVLQAATGCDDAEAEGLLAHWDALSAEYAATVTALARVNAQQQQQQHQSSNRFLQADANQN